MILALRRTSHPRAHLKGHELHLLHSFRRIDRADLTFPPRPTGTSNRRIKGNGTRREMTSKSTPRISPPAAPDPAFFRVQGPRGKAGDSVCHLAAPPGFPRVLGGVLSSRASTPDSSAPLDRLFDPSIHAELRITIEPSNSPSFAW